MIWRQFEMETQQDADGIGGPAAVP